LRPEAALGHSCHSWFPSPYPVRTCIKAPPLSGNGFPLLRVSNTDFKRADEQQTPTSSYPGLSFPSLGLFESAKIVVICGFSNPSIWADLQPISSESWSNVEQPPSAVKTTAYRELSFQRQKCHCEERRDAAISRFAQIRHVRA